MSKYCDRRPVSQTLERRVFVATGKENIRVVVARRTAGNERDYSDYLVPLGLGLYYIFGVSCLLSYDTIKIIYIVTITGCSKFRAFFRNYIYYSKSKESLEYLPWLVLAEKPEIYAFSWTKIEHPNT